MNFAFNYIQPQNLSCLVLADSSMACCLCSICHLFQWHKKVRQNAGCVNYFVKWPSWLFLNNYNYYSQSFLFNSMWVLCCNIMWNRARKCNLNSTIFFHFVAKITPLVSKMQPPNFLNFEPWELKESDCKSRAPQVPLFFLCSSNYYYCANIKILNKQAIT